MYFSIRSVSINYGDYGKPVGGAIKLSMAYLGCFQYTFSLAQLNNSN